MKLPRNEEELIKYRLNRAQETLEEADLLLKHNKMNASVNRIYYALFYAVLALLRTKHLISTKHTGVKAFFHKHFIKSGIIEENMGKFYDKMFDLRHKGEYEDFVHFEKEEVKEYLEDARKFVEKIKKYIETLKA